MSEMRLPETMTVTSGRGAAPVPSISVTPVIAMVRVGAGCWSCLDKRCCQRRQEQRECLHANLPFFGEST